MKWVWLLMAGWLLYLSGCSYLPQHRRKTYAEDDYEQIKQERIEEHKQNIKRLRPKEPSQLY